MKPSTTKSLAALCLLLAVATGASHAQSVVYSGRLDDPANTALVSSDLTAPSFVDEYAVANNVALYALDVQAAGLVSIVSTGFAAGGADPYFTLFRGADATATFVDSNYTQAFSTGGDFSFSAVLAAGAYRIALGAFANMSFAENLGSGVLGDGFVGLGVPDVLGDSSYRLVVNAPVPEPAAAWLLVAGMAALLLRRRIRP
jgi:hypothetical protein